MVQRNKRLISVVAVLVLGWIALFYSSRALLVWQWTDADAHRLSCWYVAASGPLKRTHLYMASGILGRAECARILRLDN